ncbi:MAG TPA: hypothetical protein VMU84_18895 [Thermoanaerobaculia bacterium]|nr:hypothetical protein [Thermoanaerobaculia bacterium]
MRRTLLLFAILLASSAHAFDRSDVLLARAWPYDSTAGVSEIGEGVGVVFSPDLTVPGNCRFFEALGFACFEDADWSRILDRVHTWNIIHPGRRIKTLVLETHGTNGNGLKVQKNKSAKAERSYISVAALQERLEPDGIRYVILSACNSGRLLRPAIYRSLDPNNGDKLFLPATCGIINASPTFNARRNRVTVITPGESHYELTLVGRLKELAPRTRRAIETAAKSRNVKLPVKFAVSEMLIRMLLRDPRLELRTGASVDDFSKQISTMNDSEKLFEIFATYLDTLVERDAARAIEIAGTR